MIQNKHMSNPQFQRKQHPLGWGDRELSWLVSTGMNVTNLYRAMGYKGRPGASFIKRLEQLEPGK